MNRRTKTPWSIPSRAALALAAVALPACLLVPLDGLSGGISPGHPDAGSEGGADTALPPPTAYAQAVLADDPVAYWRFDETSGVTARDFSMHGHDATYIGGVHPGAAGAIAGDSDTAATFDGATGYVDAGNAFAFSGSEPFTVEAWVRPASTQGYTGIFSREDASGGPPSEGYLGFVSPADGVYGFQRLDGNSLTSIASTSVANGSRYDHVVATYDGMAMTLYVNGMVQASGAASFAIAGAMNDFVVGAEVGGAEDFFEGQIDEVAVYEHALSANRVTAHYLVGTGQGP